MRKKSCKFLYLKSSKEGNIEGRGNAHIVTSFEKDIKGNEVCPSNERHFRDVRLKMYLLYFNIDRIYPNGDTNWLINSVDNFFCEDWKLNFKTFFSVFSPHLLHKTLSLICFIWNICDVSSYLITFMVTSCTELISKFPID